eukprot:TRINITY_DN14641_c0_g1_i1.p1 TRINITY_DN14641_c0_g1~~TRINITY_DN14641_c0_g1_i1.p1  ORF type:complete len:116 (-),score=23.49 TRINITY_DN14641_c0_g1_i1:109-456(-)
MMQARDQPVILAVPSSGRSRDDPESLKRLIVELMPGERENKDIKALARRLQLMRYENFDGTAKDAQFVYDWLDKMEKYLGMEAVVYTWTAFHQTFLEQFLGSPTLGRGAESREIH